MRAGGLYMYIMGFEEGDIHSSCFLFLIDILIAGFWLAELPLNTGGMTDMVLWGENRNSTSLISFRRQFYLTWSWVRTAELAQDSVSTWTFGECVSFTHTLF